MGLLTAPFHAYSASMQYPSAITTHVPERHSITRAEFESEIASAGQPVVLRGLVKDWPVVSAAEQSREALGNYLKQLDGGGQVNIFFGPNAMQGRYFYNEAMDGFNFEAGSTTLSKIVDQLLKIADEPNPMAIYAGSTPAPEAVPGFADANVNPLIDPSIMPRLWLSNGSRVAAHYDNSRNIACSIAGKRRFTIFPPEQITNLYLGPLEYTMAGPQASMVDFHAPDYGRYPKFREAEAAGMIADLEPGDAIYIPSLWWHHVESQGPFNLLVNYWWTEPHSGPAFESVMLAMLALRDQPEPEKAAWRAFFEHFVFAEDAAKASEHLPPRWQTVAGKPNPQRYKMVLDYIASQLAQQRT